jgi:hypothetical protein
MGQAGVLAMMRILHHRFHGFRFHLAQVQENANTPCQPIPAQGATLHMEQIGVRAMTAASLPVSHG